MQAISVIEADLARPEQQRDLLAMMDVYVADPMEEGAPLPKNIRDALIAELRRHPACHAFLAYQDGKAIGFSLCFLGFSSFEARPLLQYPRHRGTAGRSRARRGASNATGDRGEGAPASVLPPHARSTRG